MGMVMLDLNKSYPFPPGLFFSKFGCPKARMQVNHNPIRLVLHQFREVNVCLQKFLVGRWVIKVAQVMRQHGLSVLRQTK